MPNAHHLFLVNRKEEVNGILALYTCRLLLGNEILGCEKKKGRSWESGVRERSIVICGMQRSSPVEWPSVDGRHERGESRTRVQRRKSSSDSLSRQFFTSRFPLPPTHRPLPPTQLGLRVFLRLHGFGDHSRSQMLCAVHNIHSLQLLVLLPDG